MFRPLSRSVGGPLAQPRHTQRKGAILLVVLTLLALFAVIGLAFVLYAESEANSSRTARESVANTIAPVDSALVVNNFLGQIIYSNDDGNSAVNGYDMSRMVYGTSLNTVPYNGHGIFREALELPYLGLPAGSPNAIDRTQVVNFTPLSWFDPAKNATTSVFIDPDLTNGNGVVRFSAPAPFGSNAVAPLHRVARNAPYTYPDRNNIYIAVQDPATGQIVLPSYHRPTLFGALDSSTQNWMTPQGKFKLLRSRTIDNLTRAEINYIANTRNLWPDVTTAGSNLTPAQYAQLATILTGQDAAANTAVPSFKQLFPYPAANPDGTITGDVQNMKYATGATIAQNFGMQRNDSVWLDANLPIVTHRGRRLRPMVAPLMLPLDGRVNMNVTGNIMGGAAPNYASLSHQGFGPHEINLGTVANIAGNEMSQIIQNRYNNNGTLSTTVPSPRSAITNQYVFNADSLIGFYPSTVSNTNFQIFPPTYSQVNFDARGTNPPPPPPPTPDYKSNPTYYSASAPTPYTYDNSSAVEFTSNPLMFNPYQWDYFTKGATSPSTRLVPITDVRRLEARYSDKQQYLQNFSVLTQAVPSYAGTNPNNQADSTRAKLTPISNRLQRPALAPNFFGSVATTGAGVSLQLTGNTFSYQNAGTQTVPTLDLSGTSALVTTITTGGDANAATNVIMQNMRSIFGGVDINTPMPDYRDPVTRPRNAAGDPDLTVIWPMNATTVTQLSYDKATVARQAFAKSIFERLAIATGARVSVNTSTGVVTLPTPTLAGTTWSFVLNGATVMQSEYDALRWLAQLAVNIVDYIDGDDVNTPFAWNPAAADVYPYTLSYNTANNEIGHRVVFGVEKPRLVINEVYAEVTNDQGDPVNSRANNPFHVRCFIELLNPGNKETNPHSPLSGPTATDPLGAVALQLTQGALPPYSAYQVVVHTSSKQTVTALSAPDNVLGTVSTVAPKLEMQFNTGFANSTSAPGGLPMAVEPNDGKFSIDMPPASGKRNGFCVIGPDLNPNASDSEAFVPKVNTPTDPYSLMLRKTVNATLDSLDYPLATTNSNGIGNLMNNTLNSPPEQGHAVLLQRLVCPFLPKSPTNPFITVDYMTQVRVHDAIHSGNDMGGGHGHNPTLPLARRWSIGRVSPYAGYQLPMDSVNLDPQTGTQTYQTTLVLGQNPTQVPDPSLPMTQEQKVTFFRMNSTVGTIGSSQAAAIDPTLLAPFEWLTHLDRKVISAAELMTLSATRPQDLTHQFATPVASSTPNYHQQTLGNMVIANSTTVPLGSPPMGNMNPLYRVLEVLQPKPWTRGIAAGSRVPGNINLNMLWDDGTSTSSVFNALMDPQTSTTPPVNGFTAADVTAIWNGLKGTRSPSWTTTIPAVGVTSDEIDPATGAPGFDRPFKGFGVANFVAGGGVLSQTDVNSTILRLRNQTGGDNKTLFSTATVPNTSGIKNSYADLEPLRKAFNNISTTTDTYLLVFTIGYFDIIENDPSGKILVRREAYDQVPGDLRSQFAAVIDRSAIGLQIDPNTGNLTNAVGRPWFTEISTPAIPFNTTGTTTSANPATVPANTTRYYFRFLANGADANGNVLLNYDGQAITIGVGSQLRIGTGLNAPIIRVTGLGYTDPTPVQPPGLGPPALPAINLPSFDPQTGIATLVFDWPNASGTPTFMMPGAAMSGLAIPGNPGKQLGFDYTMPQYQSVLRDFSMLRPNP